MQGRVSYILELQFDECYAARGKGEEEMGMNKDKGPSSVFFLLLSVTLTYKMRMSEHTNINIHALYSILKFSVDRKESRSGISVLQEYRNIFVKNQ